MLKNLRTWYQTQQTASFNEKLQWTLQTNFVWFFFFKLYVNPILVCVCKGIVYIVRLHFIVIINFDS